jgi:hypothetical protein
MGSGVAGVLGAVLLVAYLIFRMVWSSNHPAPEPPAYRHGVAMTLFTAAAALLLVNAVHNLHLVSTSIPGESLSLGIGAAIVAAGFLVALLRGARLAASR